MNMSSVFKIVVALVIIALPLTSNSDVGWAKNNVRPVKHLFVGDETVWFLAQVYYGNGHDYKKILTANGLKDHTNIKEGTYLLIPDPKFKPYDKGYAERYTSLNDKRLKLLALKSIEEADKNKLSLQPTKVEPTRKVASEEVTVPVKKEVKKKQAPRVSSEGVKYFRAE